MIASGWLLIANILFTDGHNDRKENVLTTKELCIQDAKNSWRNFFANKIEGVANFTVICRNRNNHYDLVQVICDKSGSCNV